ncbi:MAG: hypothetical protein CMN11_16440 [Roseobacter sp.]|nr:hypothetical protein [Roseobacter sp.]|tara:strand:- start:110 stop:631 length:522 start_codon:yes stop_codon:yes gene_type:complete
MTSNGKLKISQYKSSISKLASLHENLGEMGDRTQRIILENSDIHFDNTYQGILSVEKHQSAFRIALKVVQSMSGSDAKHTSYIVSVEDLLVPSVLTSVELKWFAYNDGFVPSNNSLVGKIKLGLVELNVTFYPATAEETPNAWICFVTIENAIYPPNGRGTRANRLIKNCSAI